MATNDVLLRDERLQPFWESGHYCAVAAGTGDLQGRTYNTYAAAIRDRARVAKRSNALEGEWQAPVMALNPIFCISEDLRDVRSAMDATP